MDVLVVDDDPGVRESLERTLAFEGYTVGSASDGEEALDSIRSERPRVVILDLQMPRVDGLEVCRRLRAAGDAVPVLMLTARDGTQNLVTGFNVGADDYLSKPFALEELLVRVRSLMRRGQPAPAERATRALEFGDLSMNLDTREVSRSGRPVQLTRTEFDLLELLMRHPRQVLSRSTILREVWSVDYDYGSNTLEVYIGYLRRKLEEHGAPRIIQNVRGVGYVLRPEAP